jgi:predicted DNA-binding ribbon-helix-helix protein
MNIRKNFLLDEEIVKHLEKIAESANTTQTGVLRNLIEEKYQTIKVKERLEAFQSIIKVPSGSFVGQTVQSVKSDMATKV